MTADEKTKYYEFTRLPGIIWKQRVLSFPEFETILEKISGFYKELDTAQEFIEPLKKFFIQTLRETIAISIVPGAPTRWGRIKNFIRIRVKKINTADPIQYMDITELAEAKNDFFFLNRKSITLLNNSENPLGTTIATLLEMLTTQMTEKFIGVKSSTLSPMEDQMK